ncbi:MAG: L-threonylcarbamoyladenylate synthase [Kiritimatiellia bacterium]
MPASPERAGILPATPENVRRAAEAVRAGELAIVPTDTVYGVAARADAPEAMARLYAAKGRDASKRVAFLAADVGALRAAGVRVDAAAEKLAAAFWPGPLTLVLRNADGGWDGFRVPDHPVALAWLRELGFPAATTSANRSGEAAARTAREAWDALAPHAALALDAGPAPGGVASTVARVADGGIEILRGGPIGREALEAAAGRPVLRT